MKPFNFEEFKSGKPASIGDIIYKFRGEDSDLDFPIICTCENGINNAWVESYDLEHLTQATMLPTKRTVWIAICKHIASNIIEPDVNMYDSKEDALNEIHEKVWKVIDAIPYEIEE